VNAGHITEAYAVEALVDWSRRNSGKLREAALTLRSNADALPLAITLLDHAAQVAAARSGGRAGSRRRTPPGSR